MPDRLVLVAEPFEPWMTLINNNCIGILCNIINYLSMSLNMTYKIITIASGYGYQLPNNSWTGMFSTIFKNVRIIITNQLFN